MVAGTVAKGWPRNYGVLQGHPEPATNQTTEALLRVFDRCFRVALAVLGGHVATSDRAPATALLRARLLAGTFPCHLLHLPSLYGAECALHPEAILGKTRPVGLRHAMNHYM